ncbi:helix-turn-helix domain-containing protein [Streptomyces decoyicus]|uniref:helix-turn-helix domain-containing protein n=1 Tax=Streptomyces decoyicus TaxID=249567 RepID=UPI002E19226B
MQGAEGTSGVAALLKELKDRSGKSYGVLAKRLHMSTSTLHRYCNGDAVPTQYAPLERLARLCRATPDELVELHRQWILADETRRRERDRKQGGGDRAGVAAGVDPVAGAGAGRGAESVSEPPSESGPEHRPEPASESESAPGAAPVPPTAPRATDTNPDTDSDAASVSAPGRVAVIRPEGRPVGQVGHGGGRRRLALAAGIAVAAVAASTVLAAGLVTGGDGTGRKAAIGRTASPESGNEAARTEDGRSLSGSAKPTGTESVSQSPSASRSRTPGGKASGGGRATSPGTADRAGLPVSVDVRPYRWEDPCSQRYLVDRAPGTMPPPPPEQDARGWISALGAVSAGSQLVQVSVQGAGEGTVVLHALRVRVVGTSAPPAWNAFSMGVGCGGGITPKTFGVSLAAAQPRLTPEGGQRDFPYKVSERDPEVFKVTARAGERAVRWYMELEWSSGNRHGTLRIDDNGEPFHTAGMEGRPQYDFPLGGNEWIPTPKENG